MSKLKPVKSAASITSPKGSLLAEINNLRKELKDIKQSKKQMNILSEKSMKDYCTSLNRKSSKQKCVTSMSNTGKDRFFKASKEDTSTLKNVGSSNFAFETEKSYFQSEKKQNLKKRSYENGVIEEERQNIEINLNEIYLKQRDRKLKIDIELNKLKKLIVKLGSPQIAHQLNYIITLLNTSTHQYASKIVSLQKNQKDDFSEESLLIKRQEQEIEQLSKKLVENEQKLKQLEKTLKIKDQQDKSFDQLNSLSIAQKNEIRSHAQMLQTIVTQLEQKNIQLQQQNRILLAKLLKKQEQLILLNEDVNYLRLQTQNYKSLKQEHNDLYQNTLKQFRQYKRSKVIEIQKISQERDKWEKECKLRRNESEEISALQEQKVVLLKQLNQLRHLCTLKSTQLDDKKSLMYQNQKKVISLQSQVYKLRTQIHATKNKKEYCEFENQKLRQQMDDIKKYSKSYKKPSKMNEAQQIKTKQKQKISQQKQSASKQKYSSKSKPQIQGSGNLIKDNLKKSNSKKQFQVPQNQNYSQSQSEFEYQNQQQELTYARNIQHKKSHYNKSLKQKQQKLKALQDIHTMIRKHKKQMQI